MLDSDTPWNGTQLDWVRSEEYTARYTLASQPQATNDAAAASAAAGLPEIATSAPEAKFLNLLVKSHGARRVLEIGTLGGYSAIWTALALPEDGRLVTLEYSEKHAEVAKKNIEHAGLADKITVVVGPALESLAKLDASEPFDLVFIDADSKNDLPYFLEAKRLLRPRGVILMDNIVRYGRTADPTADDEATVGVRALLQHIQNDKEVEATVIQTIGSRGFDGIMYAVKL